MLGDELVLHQATCEAAQPADLAVQRQQVPLRRAGRARHWLAPANQRDEHPRFFYGGLLPHAT